MLAQATAVYAMAAAVVGGAITGLVALWNGRRADRTEQRNTSGTVSTSDSAVVFANQIAAFEASEKMRHDLAEQIERYQTIDAMRTARIQTLERALLDVTEQLRKGQT